MSLRLFWYFVLTGVLVLFMGSCEKPTAPPESTQQVAASAIEITELGGTWSINDANQIAITLSNVGSGPYFVSSDVPVSRYKVTLYRINEETMLREYEEIPEGATPILGSVKRLKTDYQNWTLLAPQGLHPRDAMSYKDFVITDGVLAHESLEGIDFSRSQLIVYVRMLPISQVVAEDFPSKINVIEVPVKLRNSVN